MSRLTQLVVFRLEEQRYALELPVVERVVRAVEVMPLPKAPDIVIGVIDVEGSVLPVLNVRQRFGLPGKVPSSDDQFLIARTPRRTVVLVIDEAVGVVERLDAEIVPRSGITPGLEHVRGVIRLDDGLALIHDLESFLSLEEEAALDDALSSEALA